MLPNPHNQRVDVQELVPPEPHLVFPSLTSETDLCMVCQKSGESKISTATTSSENGNSSGQGVAILRHQTGTSMPLAAQRRHVIASVSGHVIAVKVFKEGED